MKLIEITPRELRCGVGPCPAIYSSDRGTIVIIGKRLSDDEKQLLLSGKISSDEEVVELGADFFHGLTFQ